MSKILTKEEILDKNCKDDGDGKLWFSSSKIYRAMEEYKNQSPDGITEIDLNKLYSWLMDENRKPAQTHFTQGIARNIAKEIEYRIKHQHPPQSKEISEYQICPKCNGDGHLGRYNSPGISSTVTPVCDVCNGAKLLIRPIIQAPEPAPIEKDWEVVKLRNKSIYTAYKLEEIVNWFEDYNIENFEIYSVKRKSDNEVLSIGDFTQYGEIKGFYVSENKMKVNFDGHWEFLHTIEKRERNPEPPTTSFQWTDELVLMIMDLAHHNGYHKFSQKCTELFDEVKKQVPGSGYKFAGWIKNHLASKQQDNTSKEEILSNKGLHVPDYLPNNPHIVSHNPDEPQSNKEDRIEVRELGRHDYLGGNYSAFTSFWYQFRTNKPIETFSNSSIKAAIESVLNNEPIK